jgi:hypothetical protein
MQKVKRPNRELESVRKNNNKNGRSMRHNQRNHGAYPPPPIARVCVNWFFDKWHTAVEAVIPFRIVVTAIRLNMIH